MLVLARATGETIVIGEKGMVLEGPITISVNRTGKSIVKLGIDAPDDCPIRRGELTDKADIERVAHLVDEVQVEELLEALQQNQLQP